MNIRRSSGKDCEAIRQLINDMEQKTYLSPNLTGYTKPNCMMTTFCVWYVKLRTR